MNTINKNLLKKIISFFNKMKGLDQIDTDIFDTIDSCKETIDNDFNDNYLKYVSTLPKLDYKSTIKIVREVYSLFVKEKEFDKILKKLEESCSIGVGSLNKDDDNFIMKASEDKILLSGTYYDVILLSHEIGHKLRSTSYENKFNIMEGIFLETPSIILELLASDYLRDNYGVNIHADEMRQKHVLSIERINNIEKDIFLIIINLLKKGKLNIVNLYLEFIKNNNIVEYLNRNGTSVEDCILESMNDYSYDIGYILGVFVLDSNNKKELLDMFLDYRDNVLNTPFTIDPRFIKKVLNKDKYIRE